MTEIGIGLVGGGYMGKAHAVALSAVGAVFDTRPAAPAGGDLPPAARIAPNATARPTALPARRRTGAIWSPIRRWRRWSSPRPQSTHRAIAEAAFAAGKPVFCEKPLGASLEDAQAMVAAAEASGLPNMIGFNYVRTPATQFVRQLLAEGAIGEVTWFRGEHTEDFLADPDAARHLAHDGPGQWLHGRPCARIRSTACWR